MEKVFFPIDVGQQLLVRCLAWERLNIFLQPREHLRYGLHPNYAQPQIVVQLSFLPVICTNVNNPRHIPKEAIVSTQLTPSDKAEKYGIDTAG